MNWFKKNKGKRRSTERVDEEWKSLLKDVRPYGDDTDLKNVKQNVFEQIMAEAGVEKEQPRVVQLHKEAVNQNSGNRKIWWVAASLVLLLGLGGYLVNTNHFNDKIYRTAAGEKLLVQLPDGSEVTLNASSALSYKNNWDGKSTREVWLEGEAYFSVVHTLNDLQFLVYTDDVDIEVLGTEFNVNERHCKTEVVLSSGKVQLTVNNEEGKPEKPAVTMKPNQKVVVEEGGNKISQSEVKAENYSAWLSDQLIFESTTIKEVCEKLQDNLDLEIVFTDKKMMEKKFTGVVPLDNPDVFFLTLQKNYQLQIDKKGKTIVIK